MNKQNPVLFYDNLRYYDSPILIKEVTLLNKNIINADNIPYQYRKKKIKFSRRIVQIVTIFF